MRLPQLLRVFPQLLVQAYLAVEQAGQHDLDVGREELAAVVFFWADRLLVGQQIGTVAGVGGMLGLVRVHVAAGVGRGVGMWAHCILL